MWKLVPHVSPIALSSFKLQTLDPIFPSLLQLGQDPTCSGGAWQSSLYHPPSLNFDDRFLRKRRLVTSVAGIKSLLSKSQVVKIMKTLNSNSSLMIVLEYDCLMSDKYTCILFYEAFLFLHLSTPLNLSFSIFNFLQRAFG